MDNFTLSLCNLVLFMAQVYVVLLANVHDQSRSRRDILIRHDCSRLPPKASRCTTRQPRWTLLRKLRRASSVQPGSLGLGFAWKRSMSVPPPQHDPLCHSAGPQHQPYPIKANAKCSPPARQPIEAGRALPSHHTVPHHATAAPRTGGVREARTTLQSFFRNHRLRLPPFRIHNLSKSERGSRTIRDEQEQHGHSNPRLSGRWAAGSHDGGGGPAARRENGGGGPAGQEQSGWRGGGHRDRGQIHRRGAPRAPRHATPCT